jgi:hypothetical protein
MVKRVQLTRPKYTPVTSRVPLRNVVTKQVDDNSSKSSGSQDVIPVTNLVGSRGDGPPTPPTPYRGRVGGPPAVPSPQQSKNQITVTYLLELSEQLTQVQKKELLDHLALKLATSQRLNSDRDFEMWFTAVYSALLSLKLDAEGAGVGPLVVKRLLGSVEFYTPVKNFMSLSGLSKLEVNERQSVYHLLADLLVSHAMRIAHEQGFPFGLKLVGRCASNISGIVDQAFPGYVQAGLMMIVARQHCAGVNQHGE